MCIEVGETFMKQDLVFFRMGTILEGTLISGYCSSRAAIKMTKLCKVWPPK